MIALNLFINLTKSNCFHPIHCYLKYTWDKCLVLKGSKLMDYHFMDFRSIGFIDF